MKFKRIEMLGFKSFVDKTVIEFGEDLTAIVGPNGCGKSNVSDAIRWVLGEQGPKNLRAKKMEDLIFSGSADRKPLGMAEVSLTVSDLKGVVTAPQFKDYDDLVVTRRLYRSGESEYLINRNPCRLKDITDLFLDTGVSLDTFSIIEQGRIEGLVNAKPMDRRVFIEEAAGIMKYKSRRNEALRKLELAQANLLRVADVMSEKETRLRSLRRQARKATFHKEYQNEIDELEICISSLDLLRLDANLEPAEWEYARINEQNEVHSAAFSAREAEREKCRIEVAEFSEELAETRRRAVEVEGYLQRLENRLEMLSSRLVELDGEDERRREEMQSLEEESRKLEEEREQLVAREASLSREADSARLKYEESSDELNGLRSELSKWEAAEADIRKLHTSESKSLSNVRERIASGESRREAIRESIERLDKELSEATQIRNEVQKETESVAVRFNGLSVDVDSAKLELEGANAEKSRLEVMLRECEAAVAASKEALVESRSSFQVIESLENGDSNEFCGADAFRVAGVEVRNVLSEVLKVEPRYEKAIEAALGAKLKGVVVSDSESSIAAIKNLISSGRKGRGLAIPAIPRRLTLPYIPRLDGVDGGAIDLVGFPDDYRSLMESLLAGVGITRDLDAAYEAWRSGPDGITWVTLAGELVLPSGAAEGGSISDAGAGVLERKRRREELKLSAAGQESKLAGATEKEMDCRQALGRAQEEAVQVERKVRGAELARVEVEGGLRSFQEKLSVSVERCDILAAQCSDLSGELERIEVGRREAERESDRVGAVLRDAETRSAEIEKEQTRAGEQAARLEEEVSDRRVQMSEAQGKATGLRAELNRVAETIQQNISRAARRREEEEDSCQKRESLNLNLTQSHDEIDRFRREKSGLETEQGERSSVVDDVRARDEELANLLREMRDEAVRIQSSLSEAAERRTTLRVQRNSMVESARNDFDLDLIALAQENKEQLTSYDEHTTRLEMLRTRLSRMGVVNPLAAQEFDEINQEYSFLKEQQEDLEKSIKDLHLTIDKLNQTTRRRFLEAFEHVSTQFADIFGRLFQGGEARMYLIDPNDPLETGVDIEVRPPGKRPANIMLLSAGEKALTALALLFSVFSVRPSPFCLLDEVDATLDDANVGRFRDVIAELEDKSQFILITHNKRTMSYATRLYGVTQREKGVSIIVSVKMNRADENENRADGREVAEAEVATEGEEVAAAMDSGSA